MTNWIETENDGLHEYFGADKKRSAKWRQHSNRDIVIALEGDSICDHYVFIGETTETYLAAAICEDWVQSAIIDNSFRHIETRTQKFDFNKRSW